MYYLKDNEKIIIADTSKENIINTLMFLPQYKDLPILETKEDEIIVDFQLMKRSEFKEIETKTKQEVFNQEFFKTSLGYIRRQVNMATGDKKDFLSDLLPTISMAVQSGQTVPVITYKEPDFTQELTLEYMESLQEVKNVTPAFIQECFVQVSTDFLAVPLVVDEKV